MSMLKIFDENSAANPKTVTDFDGIASHLHDIGVQFERWQANRPLDAAADNDTILEAYDESVQRLKNQYGFQSADVVALTPDNPKKGELRAKFLDEHVHSDFEVRFFVDGKGLFYIHKNGKVYATLCEKGDLISVPANTPHWFDMGENPNFKCVRLFTTPEGWVADFTGSDIAKQFPTFDQFAAA